VVRRNGWSAVTAEVKTVYKSPIVRLWSTWWVVAGATHNILGNYYANQFQNLDPEARVILFM
jgi:hypothetical protein